MVTIITAHNRACHQAALEGMYRDRKRVFVDDLGWDLQVHDGLEQDQFDTDAAVYLLVLDEDGAHLGSVRLLPTRGPHLLGDVFPHLCEGGPPIGQDVWEITRLCTRPGLDDPRRVRQQILIALAEFALLMGVSRYTCVTHLPFLARLLAIGWDCEPLGLPIRDHGVEIGAMVIRITPETLVMLRRRAGVRGSLLDAIFSKAA